MQKNNHRVLVAALDWGLGHATRTVPLIRKLQSEGKEVILASAGSAYEFYRSYFPELKLLRKPGYGVRYFKGFPFLFSIFLQFPTILFAIIREYFWLKKTIRKEGIAQVVSDNCYGLRNKNIKSIFITHQINIVCPPPFTILEPLVKAFVTYFIKKFDECHVPDFAGENNLSGRLSHSSDLPSNLTYIGALSRFSESVIQYNNISNDKIEVKNAEENYVFEIVVIVSGPEPQREFFEKSCIRLLKENKTKACIIRGIPGEMSEYKNQNITMFSHLDDKHFIHILKRAKKIVCRSGYSTIMDLTALNLTALLVPTEGQTEQEYLAAFHSEKGTFKSITESELKSEDFIVS